MIDWYVVEYLYPKSMGLFLKTMFPNTGIPSLSLLSNYDNKKIYGFFEKNGIQLTIEEITKNNWIFTINLLNGNVIFPQQNGSTTRTETEINGIYFCFNYIENKLD